MPSRSVLTAAAVALATLGFSACKPVYTDTFTYRKNSFRAPVAKAPDIKMAPEAPHVLEGAAGPGGAMPGPGAVPGLPGPNPGVLPGLPGAAPAVPPAPGVPAVPGL